MSWGRRTGIMLCQPFDEKKALRILKSGPALIQPKLDGERCWVSWSESEPLLWSSEGNPIKSVPHIVEALRCAAKSDPIITRMPLDGELYSHGLSFEEIHSRVGRTKNVHPDYRSIEFHVFDYKSQEIQLERAINLCLIDVLDNPYLHRVHSSAVATLIDIEREYMRIVGEGYEGIILRHNEAPYFEGRPWYILKFKPKKSDVYQIIGVEEAVSEDGWYLRRIGALQLRDRYDNVFKAGTGVGFTHETLKELFEKDLRGSWARITYQNLTDKGVPRFGKFVEIIPKELGNFE